MRFFSLSISYKLALGFILITFITISVALYSVSELRKEVSLIEKMFHHPYAVSKTVKSLQVDIQNMTLTAHKILYVQDELKCLELQKNLYSYDTQIQKKILLLKERYLGKSEDIERIDYQFQQTKKFREQFLNLLNSGSRDQAELFMFEVGERHIDVMAHNINEISKFADNKANEFFYNAKDSEESTIFYLTVSILIAVILSLIISLYTIKKILSPIKQLLKTTEEIIDGDTTLEKNPNIISLLDRDDEIGKLFNAFERLMKNLLLPYQNIISHKKPLIEKTLELQRLLTSFDKNIIASKTDIYGRIIYVSKAFEKNSGFSKKELLSKSHNLTRHPDVPKEFYKELWATIEAGKVWTGDIKNKTKEGDFFWTHTVISPDYDSKEEIVGYNAISENITLAKAYEDLSQTLEDRVQKEIRKNEAKTAFIIQQSRLAQMGEMISMIAHQWRQPLASISAVSNTLLLDIMMGNYKEDFFKERLSVIGELSQHLSSTIDDFRDFFKEKKTKESVSLEKIINSCIQVIQTSLDNKNIKLNMDIDSTVVVEVFANELKQVILNLLKNAEDALVENDVNEATIWIKAYKEDSYVIIAIEDNAGGIPETIEDKIFDPYFSTKKQKDGTGLGLYMSKIITEGHCDGKLQFTNTERGACFTITLPFQSSEELS